MSKPLPAANNGAPPRKPEPKLIGARLEVARLRKFPDSSVRAVGRELSAAYQIGGQTYYWHERGERAPKPLMLKAYAAFFDVPVGYFLDGTNAKRYENEARAVARRKGRMLRIDCLNGAAPALTDPVNQPIRKENFPLPKPETIRFIVKLMVSDLKDIAEGRVKLSEITGEKLPVPPHLDLSDEIAWWQIPDYDHSMVGDSEATFPPGTICLLDLKAAIEPGQYVVAMLASQDEPLVRRYVSDRRWAPGVKFRLEALNPNSDAVRVEDPADCQLVIRIRFSGSPR